MDAVTTVPAPAGEPPLGYAPGSPERARLARRLDELAGRHTSVPMVIGGERRLGGGGRTELVQPHHHAARLGTLGAATAADVRAAVDAALAAGEQWRQLPFDERAAVFLRAADLLAGPWRQTLVAATVLGQSKSVQQAEDDAACALADRWRLDAHAAGLLLAEQPSSGPGTWNRADHRPLEGFVCAITPADSTADAGSLPTGPALLGNTVLWKPAPAQSLAAHLTMLLLEEAGLPPGVVNLVTGDGQAVTEVALRDPALAGLHFAGSAGVLRRLWREIGVNIGRYRGFPRIAGTTGGGDFLLAHPSAEPAAVRTALIRGAFAHQGQGRSALSRAYLPRGLWRRIRDDFLGEVDELAVGDVTDPSNFMGALIDGRTFADAVGAVERAKADPAVQVLAGGQYDDAIGWFVRPTVLLGGTDRYGGCAGPLLAVRVYEDDRWEEALERVGAEAPDGRPAGSVFGRDRRALARAVERLRFAAGDLRVNGEPSAGGPAAAARDLARWTAVRAIRETFIPPTDYVHPHMEWSPE
ncbi:aldehyde dehydrogenase family protein [Kitasatospora sp. NA04385]|uniref:aldehyde dehydrogenase family protein n=1 Tax=Kitasatospora sp. NA04385 TaxID=2742135 RepID=UPI001591FF8E|nr:aldehyde dehydrogenase family protein [Kitasatospora sp. NA04385]QKW24243.1 aldehyde dehydrogenase family protein [Kitasatospora sp. NA04385]